MKYQKIAVLCLGIALSLSGACTQPPTPEPQPTEKEKKEALLAKSGSELEKRYCLIADDAASGRSANLPRHLAKLTREDCLEIVLGGLTNFAYAKEYWSVDVDKRICKTEDIQFWFLWGKEHVAGKVNCAAWSELK